MNFWAWGGQYIDHRNGDFLYTSRGKPIGKFYEDELYDFRGHYIGEIKNSNRIIVNMSKKNNRKAGAAKPCGVIGSSYCNYAGYVMYAGYEDFIVS